MGRPLVSPAKGIYKPADLPYALGWHSTAVHPGQALPSGLAAVAAERY